MDLSADDLGPMSRAAALSRGIGPRELAGPLWRRAHRNVHVWAALDPDAPSLRAAAAGLVVPLGGALGGWTAAALHGAHDFDGRSAGGDPLPLLVCLPRSSRIVRPGQGLRVFRSDLAPGDVDLEAGLPVTSRLRTCFDLGRRSADLESAVTVLDSSMRDLGVRVEELSRYLGARPRWRGVPLLGRALPLVDTRSASPPESRLRFCWVVQAGLPAPEVNCEVRSRDGHLIAVPDLLDVASGLVGEFDGAQHGELARRTADHVREESLESAGIVVVRATALDLQDDRRPLVRRLQTGWRRASARSAEPAWVLGVHRRRAA